MAEVGATGTAYFVEYPFSFEDTRKPLSLHRGKTYEVIAIVDLPQIEFENFITDMTQWREFIDEHGLKCRVTTDGVWQSILVRQKGSDDGYLVMTDGYEYPRWVAYLAT